MSAVTPDVTHDECVWSCFKGMCGIILFGIFFALGGGLLKVSIYDSLVAWAAVLSLVGAGSFGWYVLRSNVRSALMAISIPLACIASALAGYTPHHASMLGLPQSTALAYLVISAFLCVSLSALLLSSLRTEDDLLVLWRASALWLYFALLPASWGFALWAWHTDMPSIVSVLIMPIAVCLTLLLGLCLETRCGGRAQ